MAGSDSNLMVRLDSETKSFIARAAELRRVSMSEYVRMVTGTQARAEVEEAEQNIIKLTPEGQRAFWEALQAEPELTDAQRELGAVMRGEESPKSAKSEPSEKNEP